MSSPYGSSFYALPEFLKDTPNSKSPQEGIHLYHFSRSYYSQAPRQLLHESDLKWTSHPINLALMDQYKASYVELNPFCVVPTLVKDGKVTTDCDNILDSFTKEFAPHLIPQDENERTCMDKWLKDVQKLKIEELSYGNVPGFPKPWWLQRVTKPQHDNKKQALTKLIAKHEKNPDQFLLHAYKTKLQATSEHQRQFSSEENMTEIFASVIELLDNMESQLSTGPASSSSDGEGFLCSKEYSLVDLYYGIFLYRLCFLNMGVDRLWGGSAKNNNLERPELTKYAGRLFSRRSFKTAVEEKGGWKFMIAMGADFVKNIFHKSDSV